MGVERFEEMLDALVSAGISEVDVLGGEPTLLSGLTRMIEAAAERQMAVSLSSNGANPSVLSELSEKFGPRQLTIGVSLHDTEIHEELDRFIHEKRPLLKGVASRKRFTPMSARRYLEETDIPYYALFMDTLMPADLETALSFPEYSRALDDLKDEFPHAAGVYCGGFVPDLGRYPSLAGVRCPAGITKLSVTPEGDVYPCYLFFRHKEYRLGNIFRDELKEMMGQGSLAFFREFAGNTCPKTSCGIFEQCHGGCPAVSLVCRGDISAPDPRCVR